MRQVLIVIRGAPASGKTTLGKHLRNPNNKIVWLQVDAFKRFFSDRFDTLLDEVNKASLATLDYLLDQGYSVVLDGIFKNREHQKALDMAKNKGLPSVVYELKCSLKTLLERDQTREGVNERHRIPMDPKIVESIYNELQQAPIKGAIELNTEDKNLQECIDIISKNFE